MYTPELIEIITEPNYGMNIYSILISISPTTISTNCNTDIINDDM